MGGFPVRPEVLRVLEANFQGKRVTRDDLVQRTRFTEAQIRSAMRGLAETEGSGVEVVARGNVWDYKVGIPAQREPQQAPPKVPGPRQRKVVDTIFEAVGTSLEGETLVRGAESNRIYKVVPV